MALSGIFFLAAVSPFMAASPPSWTPITGNQYNMVAFGKVYFNGQPIQQEDFYVGSFGPGGTTDCRSVSAVDAMGNYFATIRSSTDGEAIHFLLYEGNSTMTYDLPETLTFQSDALFAGFDLHVTYLTAFAVSGSVTWNGSPLAGVTLSGLPGDPTPVTDASGFYTATIERGWSGSVKPILAGYSFTPASRIYTDVTTNQENQDYSSTLNAYTISGTVTWNGSPLENVTLAGLPGNPVTNSSGVYSASVNYGWSGTVTPTRQYFTFTPASTIYSGIASNRITNYSAALHQSLVVTSPALGALWEKGKTYAITWMKQGTQNANVKIQLYKGSSTLVKTITTATANNGSYDWLVPMALAVGSTYFIKVKTVDNLIYGNSDKFSIIIPTITVTTPIAGTVWVKNATKTITWTKRGTQDANVKIQLFKGTTKKLDITPSTLNSGSFDWTVPATLANGTYTIRITTLDDKVKGTSQSFTITIGTIKVIQPAAGTVWQRGMVHIITWTKEGDLINASVKIQILKGTAIISTLTKSTVNDGSYEWTIPSGQALASTYKVRITTVDNLVKADSGKFTISSSVGLNLLTPNGEEILKPQEPYVIRWREDPEVLEVKLEYSRDNGETYTTIADHVEDTGSYEWLVPMNFTANGIVRVSDANGSPWLSEGLLETGFRFRWDGEGEATVWFGSNDPKAPSYGFGRIDIGNGTIGFGGFSKVIEPLTGTWHEMRVRLDLRRDTAEIRLDDRMLFENAALNTTHERYFEPGFVLQTGGEKALGFMMDNLAINIVRLASTGEDLQLFNALNEDFNRYDGKVNVLENCWQLQGANQFESKIEISNENAGNRSLRLSTAAGKQVLLRLQLSLPERIPFDISAKCLIIEN